MAGSITFNGLSSGLDTASIVTQLTTLKTSQLVTPVQNRLANATSKKSAMEDFKSAVTSLGSASDALNDLVSNVFSARTATSSNTSLVSILSTTSDKIINGTYTISNITQLAQPDRVIFSGVADSDTTKFGSGTETITLKVGSGTEYRINIDEDDSTLEGIAAAINNAGTDIQAAIINDGQSTNPYRLTLTSKSTGSDKVITHDLNTVFAGLTVDAISTNEENEPQNAKFTLNGMATESKTNNVESAIPGMTFTIKEKSTSTVTVTAEMDTSSIMSKINSFVSAYNTVIGKISSHLKYNSTTKAVGILGNDPTLHSAHEYLNSTATRRYVELSGNQYQSLSQIGITMNSSNQLVVNTSKLTEALKSSPSSVQALFQGKGTVKGIAGRISDYANKLTDSSTGVLTKNITQLTSSITSLGKLVTERQASVTKYTTLLQKKFNNMEAALAKLKTQGDYWTQQTATSSSSSS